MNLFKQVIKSIRTNPDDWKVDEEEKTFWFAADGRTTEKSSDLKIDISDPKKYYIYVKDRGRIPMKWWQDVKFADAFKDWATRPMKEVLK